VSVFKHRDVIGDAKSQVAIVRNNQRCGMNPLLEFYDICGVWLSY